MIKESAIIMAADDLAILSRSRVSLWSPDIPLDVLQRDAPPVPPAYIVSDQKGFYVSKKEDSVSNLSELKVWGGAHDNSVLLVPEKSDTAHTSEIAKNFNFMLLHRWLEQPTLDWVFSVPRSWRRYAPVPAANIVMAAQASFVQGEVQFSMEFAHFAAGSWFRSRYKHYQARSVLPARVGQISIMYGAALDARYKASLCLREAGAQGLFARVCADLSDIRALLKHRDPGNLPRRPALLHNVGGHHRKTKRASVNVREHFRGSYRCSWLGLDAYLVPSEYDMERLDYSVVAQQCVEALEAAGSPIIAAASP